MPQSAVDHSPTPVTAGVKADVKANEDASSASLCHGPVRQPNFGLV
jgi:hypothetical protein